MKWGVVAALLVLGAAIAWWAFDEAPAPAVTNDVARETTPASSTTSRDVEARVVAAPPSLRGTELDGEIRWLDDGSVRVDLALRRRFDHLLSAIGEVTLAQVRTRLQTELQPVAPADRVAAVMALFDRYTAYLDAVTRVQPDAEPRKRLQQAHDLRVAKLGAEMARAFYEDEERADELAITRRELVQRGESTAEIDAKLAPEVQQLQDALQQTARFNAEGVSAEERRRVREAQFGTEAAARLATLDDERAAWNAKLEAFKAQRRRLEPLDADDEKQLEVTLERDFSEPERRRVRALLAEE